LNNHLIILIVFLSLFTLHNSQEADCSEYQIKIDELNSEIEALQLKMKSLILENEELKEWKRKKEEEEKKKAEEGKVEIIENGGKDQLEKIEEEKKNHTEGVENHLSFIHIKRL